MSVIMYRIHGFSCLESQRPGSDKGEGYNDAIGGEEICPLSAVLLTQEYDRTSTTTSPSTSAKESQYHTAIQDAVTLQN